MQIQLFKDGIGLSRAEEQLIERNSRKLERLLARYHSDAASLRLSFRSRGSKKLREARAILRMPEKTLIAHHEGHELTPSSVKPLTTWSTKPADTQN
jgi:cob(I)alamin adenosyltransferase